MKYFKKSDLIFYLSGGASALDVLDLLTNELRSNPLDWHQHIDEMRESLPNDRLTMAAFLTNGLTMKLGRAAKVILRGLASLFNLEGDMKDFILNKYYPEVVWSDFLKGKFVS